MYVGKGYSALRRGRDYSVGQVFHLVFSTKGRQPFFSDFYVARLMVNALKYSDECGWSETVAFVVMPDHVHWLVRTVVKTPDQLAASVKKFVARYSRPRVRWQKGFYDNGVRNEGELINIARYVIANPKRAGLVMHVMDYPHWDCVYL